MARQDGVITLDQALAAGMTGKAIDWRISSGEWTRLHRGVYLRADRQHSPAVRLRSAVYAAGAGAVAHGPSAAWWHGLIEKAPAQAWITIPKKRRLRQTAGLRLRHRDLAWPDRAKVRNLAVTDIPLTVLEAAVELRDGSVLMDRALQRHTTLPILQAVHERNEGRTGTAAAAKLLLAAGEGGASEAERMLLRLLRRASVTGWQSPVHSCGFEIDVAFVRERVAIEVDGWAWHRDVERFNRDSERQNMLVNAGWHVLRFTWHHLMHEPDRVLAEIRTAMHRL